jgi:ankyrin repeat protein
VSDSLPQARELPARPNLGYLKKLAKQRLIAMRSHRHGARLAEAQLAVAREHGFASWRKLKANVAASTNRVPAEQIAILESAIRKGDTSSVRGILRKSPSITNCANGNGASPLHVAAEHNQPQIVQLLVAAGADVSAKFGRSGHTPLSWAVTVGSFDAAETLVQTGVKPDLFCAAGMGDLRAVRSFFTEEGSLTVGASQTGSTRYNTDGNIFSCPPSIDVEIISDALYAAARNGRASVVKELLAHKPDLAFRAYMGGTPLHWAHFSGSRETIDLLRAAGANPSSLDHAFKCTPRAFGICVPANWGISRLVSERLREDPSLASIFEGRGTPLHEAARGGQRAIVELLLGAGADPSLRDKDGKTTLELAQDNEHTEVAEVLRSSIPMRDEVLSTFLDAAVPRPDSHHKSGSLQPAKKVLAEYPGLVDSSIFAAVTAGDLKVTQRLLAKDPSLASATGGVRNWPALCYLTFSRFLRDEKKRAAQFVKCAKLLLAAGADPNSSWPAPGDPTYRETALYGAAGVANCAPLTKLLIEAGADVDDHEPLYHASEFNDNAALRVLLKAKPDPKWVSYNLCHKMDMEDPAGVRLFIKHGADVNVLLENGLFKGSRPLHFAIYRRRSLTVFRLLLGAGADPNLADTKGVTPYQLARKLGLNSVAKLLRSKGGVDDLDTRAEFVAALSSGDRKTAEAMLRDNPGLKESLTESDHKLLVDAAEAGNAEGVRLMLDIGFPIGVRGAGYGGWDASALDYAAWLGHAPIVRLLLKRGADPTVKHGYGGDALAAAIHGASHSGHNRGLAAVKALAIVAGDERLERAVEGAKTEPNRKVVAMLERLLRARGAKGSSVKRK